MGISQMVFFSNYNKYVITKLRLDSLVIYGRLTPETWAGILEKKTLPTTVICARILHQ